MHSNRRRKRGHRGQVLSGLATNADEWEALFMLNQAMDNSPVYLCWFIYTLCKASILGIHSLMNDGQILLDTQIHTVCALQEDVAVQRPVMHECMLVSVARCTFGRINAEISLLILLNINISTKQSLKTALRPCTIQKYYAFIWFCLFWFLYRNRRKE